jgi:hypothetical protein
MTAYIYSNKMLIGTTEFINNLGSMGHIFGNFFPTENYGKVKRLVQNFTEQTSKDYKQWHALRFNVQLENGYFILPAGGYEILDFADFPNELIELHLAGIHSHIYRDYFELKKPFLIDPWERLNIEQKIDIEDELHNLIGETNVTLSALGKHKIKKEVLFSIDGIGGYSFVVGDLTSNKEITIDNIFLQENYYTDFDDFTFRRMQTHFGSR